MAKSEESAVFASKLTEATNNVLRPIFLGQGDSAEGARAA